MKPGRTQANLFDCWTKWLKTRLGLDRKVWVTIRIRPSQPKLASYLSRAQAASAVCILIGSKRAMVWPGQLDNSHPHPQGAYTQTRHGGFFQVFSWQKQQHNNKTTNKNDVRVVVVVIFLSRKWDSVLQQKTSFLWRKHPFDFPNDVREYAVVHLSELPQALEDRKMTTNKISQPPAPPSLNRTDTKWCPTQNPMSSV